MQVWFNTDNFVTRLIGPETAHIIDSYKNDAASYDALQKYAEAQARIESGKAAFKEKMKRARFLSKKIKTTNGEEKKYAEVVNAMLPRVMAKSILYKSLYYCPVNTGALRASARIFQKGNGYIIRYGNNKVDYAVYVHEIPILTNNSGKKIYQHKAPTQYKYLEDAAIEVKDEILEEFGNASKLRIPKLKLMYGPQYMELFIDVDPMTMKVSQEINKYHTLEDLTNTYSNKDEFLSIQNIYEMVDEETTFKYNEDYYTELFSDIMDTGYVGDRRDDESLKAFIMNAMAKFKKI